MNYIESKPFSRKPLLLYSKFKEICADFFVVVTQTNRFGLVLGNKGQIFKLNGETFYLIKCQQCWQVVL